MKKIYKMSETFSGSKAASLVIDFIDHRQQEMV